VRQNPFTVVLLDEFEKGHANIADLFLQVFDDGRLTDAQGETVGFHHALIILTSNLGSDVAALESSIGFAGEPKASDRKIDQAIRRALEQHHRPEFLNRIDRILSLRPLRRDDLKRIARRELGKVYKREGFVERDLLLEVDDSVIDLLLERGIDPKYGARPLKRAIEELLVIPLARALLSNDWRRFQLLRVARKGNGVDISFEETEVSKKLENLERRSRVSDGEGRMLTIALRDVRAGIGDAYEASNRCNANSKRSPIASRRLRSGRTPSVARERSFANIASRWR
jgi:ATP-dependent Clp protease ATP-binding subunit ClpC